MKKKIIGAVAVVIIMAVIFHTYDSSNKKKATQTSIASQVIRLHVIANSDEKEDQELKLYIKDNIVSMLRDSLAGASDINEARKIIRNEMEEIEQTATSQMKEKGYNYTANATLGNVYFPAKKYGDLTFPEGEYEALKVNIGKSEGKNWWCVMYPTLCFVDSTYQVVPEESKETLKQNLSSEDYQMLLNGDSEVTFGFKFLDWVDNFLH